MKLDQEESLGPAYERMLRNRPTPQVTIEAVLYCVRERGLAALKEPANLERLSRCDGAARAQINEWIAKLEKRVALRIGTHGVGFERLPECTAASPMRKNAARLRTRDE
jgi:hypothetical protein